MTLTTLSRAAMAVIGASFGMTPAAHAAVTISSAATANMSCTAGVCSPTAANAVLNVGDLTSMLASGSVTVNTGTGSLPAEVEDIVVASTFNWASANSLTLDAYRSVTVTAPVAVNGAAPVSLVTNDGGSGGNLSFISGGSLSFLGTSNSLAINGEAYTLEDSIATLAAAVARKDSGYYALSTSYDASHDSTYRTSPIHTKFKGTLNGLGNAISNLTVKSRDSHLGFFAQVSAHGAIDSLTLTNAKIGARPPKVRTSTTMGALVGVSYGTVFNSFASGTIEVSVGNFGVTVGGLLGSNWGTILDSASTISINATDKSSNFVGQIGRLVGLNAGALFASDARGSVSLNQGDSSNVAGLAGGNDGVIENCYAEGAAAVPEGSTSVGGLVGDNASTIENSFSTGAPTAGNNAFVGGFAGFDQSHGGLSNTYWNTTTSGITNLGQGAGSPANDPGISGETTAQLQAALPAGFDPTIWAESPSINNGLPYLINNPPQ
jgi:hypothetical protein